MEGSRGGSEKVDDSRAKAGYTIVIHSGPSGFASMCWQWLAKCDQIPVAYWQWLAKCDQIAYWRVFSKSSGFACWRLWRVFSKSSGFACWRWWRVFSKSSGFAWWRVFGLTSFA